MSRKFTKDEVLIAVMDSGDDVSNNSDSGDPDYEYDDDGQSEDDVEDRDVENGGRVDSDAEKEKDGDSGRKEGGVSGRERDGECGRKRHGEGGRKDGGDGERGTDGGGGRKDGSGGERKTDGEGGPKDGGGGGRETDGEGWRQDGYIEGGHVGREGDRRGARKRKRSVCAWKKVVKKRKVNTGETSARKVCDGHVGNGRNIRESCGECRMKCADRISMAERQKVFHEFWGMNDKSRRRDFVIAHAQRCQKKRSMVENSRRTYSIKYSLPTKYNDNEYVCKFFFLNTLDISENMVRYNLDNAEGGIVQCRPCRTPINKTSIEKMSEVENHISSFPKVDSHYCRAGTKRQYLDASLTIKRMYMLNVEKCNNTGTLPVKENVYRKTFNENFNLGFHVPSKDVCDTCAQFEILKNADQVTEAKQREMDDHLARKQAARDSKAHDKLPQQGLVTAVFDLQQVMPCPKLSVGVSYYLRKLSVYNLTVLELQTMQGHCYTWHEGEAGRGANEIGSVVSVWLKDQDNKSARHVILYSDSCGGQNRNRIMCTAIILSLSKSKHITTVEQKFFEPGHSQNECDSMHSCIEREFKSKDVHLPSGFQESMLLANRKQKYTVTEITHSDIQDFCKLNDTVFKQNAFQGIMTARQIVYQKTDEGVKVHFADNIGGELQERSYLKRGRPVILKMLQAQLAYESALAIDKDKKRDITKLCAFIPHDCHAFYAKLKVNGT